MKELNRALIAAKGEPEWHHDLYDRGIVENALERAQAHYEATGDITEAVAILAARLSKYQPFRNTNHRTAHAVARLVMEANGYPGLIQDEDSEVADILAQDRDPYQPIDTQVRQLTKVFRDREKAMLLKLRKGENATTTKVPTAEDVAPAEKPAPDVVAKQDPTYTREQFEEDLFRVTRRLRESS